MKGKINLTVEVDLSQVICEDSLEALKMFTNSKDLNGVVSYYMQNVARAIYSIPELNLPNVKYQITGEYEEGQSDIGEYMLEDVADDSERVITNIEEEFGVDLEEHTEALNVTDKEFAYERITQIISDCTENKGVPKELFVSPELYDLIFVDGEKKATKFLGCDVIPESLQGCLLQVSYTPYGTDGTDYFAVEKL